MVLLPWFGDGTLFIASKTKKELCSSLHVCDNKTFMSCTYVTENLF